jgi:putative DNA primase/helicase
MTTIRNTVKRRRGNGRGARRQFERDTASELCIADFNNEARWCAWREEERVNKDGESKRTKIPYCHYRNGDDYMKAQSNNPQTWITRREAEACWQKMHCEGQDAAGGVGLFQGDLGNGYSLMGIDLDRCYANGDTAPWAIEVICRFDSYAEVSPSEAVLLGR